MKADSVAIITGAGSGLGRALARTLTGKGWRAVLVGRRKAQLLETQDECLGTGARPGACQLVVADIAERGSEAAIVDAAVHAYGRIDALVNNAGLARFAPLERANLDDFEQMLRTNVVAPASLIKQALPHLRTTQGTVVNVGSIGGILALPRRACYGATKAALHHLTRSLARELAPDVRVNAVVPGAVDTEMYDHLELPAADVDALRASLVASTPLGRMGTAQDVVAWIEQLLGPAGKWTTGSLLVVDGGRSS